SFNSISTTGFTVVNVTGPATIGSGSCSHQSYSQSTGPQLSGYATSATTTTTVTQNAAEGCLRDVMRAHSNDLRCSTGSKMQINSEKDAENQQCDRLKACGHCCQAGAESSKFRNGNEHCGHGPERRNKVDESCVPLDRSGRTPNDPRRVRTDPHQPPECN